MAFGQFTRKHRYTGLRGDDEAWSIPVNRASTRASIRSILVSSILIGSLLAAGFFAGSTATRMRLRPDIELNSVLQVFEYNRTFGEAPSPQTNRGWEDLFPKQGGFFKHPKLAPQRSAFSVFHQLHCLDGIRHGFWAAFDAAREGRKIDEDDLPMMSSPAHIRHCIDLLRHTLMCQPDITIEIKDDSVGGVKGFGTEHQCKDWDQLVRWTTQWETYSDKTMERASKDDANGHEGARLN